MLKKIIYAKYIYNNEIQYHGKKINRFQVKLDPNIYTHAYIYVVHVLWM